MISTIIDSNDLTLLELKNFIVKNPAKTIQEKGFKKTISNTTFYYFKN